MDTKNFFKKKTHLFKNLYPSLKIEKKLLIQNVKPLYSANKNDITFFDSIRYKSSALKTKAYACITTEKLKN